MTDSNFRTLREWEEFFGGRIKARTLRSELRKGCIRAIRVTDSCNAPILISAKEMDLWLEEVAGNRQIVLSPTETREIHESANAVELATTSRVKQ